MTQPVPRRRFLQAAAAMTAGTLGACTGRAGRRSTQAVAGAAAGPGRPLVVGCIAPFSGPYAAVGQIVSAGLSAATTHIARDLGGSFGGWRPVVVTADAPLTAADGQRAYAKLTSQKVDAVLWCGAQGLAETLPSIVQDVTPVIAVGTDIQSRSAFDRQVPNLTTHDGAGFPVFQTSLPDVAAVDLLLRYAGADRGFTRAVLVYSGTASPALNTAFTAACAAHGISDVGAPSFDTSAGAPNLASLVAALPATRAEAVVFVGAAPDAAALVTLLDGAGAGYVDTPTAKGGGFRPMVLGGAAATGSALFSRLAGVHAAKGTIAAATLGAAVALPGVALREWVRRFMPTYNGGFPQGGEDGPADALAALLRAAALADSTAGADLIAALETGFETQFATGIPLSFAPSRHLSVGSGDECLLTLEYEPEARYDLGIEWQTVLPPRYRAPDLLVDPTLDANRRAHPDLFREVLGQHYGVSRQPAYQGGDPQKVAACAAVH